MSGDLAPHCELCRSFLHDGCIWRCVVGVLAMMRCRNACMPCVLRQGATIRVDDVYCMGTGLRAQVLYLEVLCAGWGCRHW